MEIKANAQNSPTELISFGKIFTPNFGRWKLKVLCSPIFFYLAVLINFYIVKNHFSFIECILFYRIQV